MTTQMQQTMLQAMQLMRQGDLKAATLALQQGLHGDRSSDQSASRWDRRPGPIDLDGEYVVVSGEAPEAGREPPRGPGRHDGVGSFTAERFAGGTGALDYKLFVPDAVPEGTTPPLLLMLHGCTQTPDDFARGTRMNALARQHGYVVAYPAQAQGSNASRCWNWFRAQDQQRGRGEAALLAELARHLVDAHKLDERRVYAAGLSAGGAMAAVLANTYPDLFAAIGVHSGLPFGVAHDLPTAFAAMKRAQRSGRKPARGATAVPAIVFHGDADRTVDPGNGPAVIEQLAGHAEHMNDVDGVRVTVEKGSVPGGQSYTRTVFRDAAGNLSAEHWTVHGGGHAWSGGDSSGSYTDPSGPNASAEMLRFFSETVRSKLN